MKVLLILLCLVVYVLSSDQSAAQINAVQTRGAGGDMNLRTATFCVSNRGRTPQELRQLLVANQRPLGHSYMNPR